jgi:release factor glutamine methyltransferase
MNGASEFMPRGRHLRLPASALLQDRPGQPLIGAMARDDEAWRARTFSEAVDHVAERLSAAGIETARGDAWLLAAAATGRPRASLMAGGPDAPSAAELARLDELARRRSAREPMAYILGEKEFWSLPFRVSPAALIPRPETETVVEAALAQIRDRGAPLRILDLGTGSGCLLLALLSELPRALGLGVDRSPEALRLAMTNAGRLKLAPRARFERRSWATGLEGVFDLIVSNPPYVGAADAARLAPEIRDFEPQLALVAGPDGLDAYRALVPDCARLLAPGGALALEIGQGQGDAVAALLARHGFAVVERRPDLAGIERCLVARARPA